MINPRYTSIEQTSSSRVRRYGIDNHPGGSINLSERINRAEHGRLARRPWAKIHFFMLTRTYITDTIRENCFKLNETGRGKFLSMLSMAEKIIKPSNIGQKKILDYQLLCFNLK